MLHNLGQYYRLYALFVDNVIRYGLNHYAMINESRETSFELGTASKYNSTGGYVLSELYQKSGEEPHISKNSH